MTRRVTSRLLPVLAALGLVACGPDVGSGPGIDLALVASRNLLDQISAFQVSLVTKGTSLDCVAVQKKCLVNQVDPTRFVLVQDAAGKSAKALVFPLALVAGTPNTQDVSLRNVPPGKDFALVVEAMSKDTTPRLAGSSCNYLKEIGPGTNPTVYAQITMLSPAEACDPRVP